MAMSKEELTIRLQLTTALSEQFGRKNSESGLMMFVNATADIPLADFERSVMQAARVCRFMPTPAEVRQVNLPTPVDVQSRAILAWDEVRRAISVHGGYQTVQFDDPVTAAAVRAIGSWNDLCETETDQMLWKKKEFIEAYKAVYSLGVVRDVDVSGLPGILASDARRFGYSDPSSVHVPTRLPPPAVNVIESPKVVPRITHVVEVSRALSISKSVEKEPDPKPELMITEITESRADALQRLKQSKHWETRHPDARQIEG